MWLRLLSLIFLLGGVVVYAQADQSAELDSLMQEVMNNDSLDNYDESFAYDSLAQVYVRLDDKCGEIFARVKQSGSLDGLGLVDSALSVLLYSESRIGDDCDTAILEEMYLNFSNVYLSLGDLDNVDAVAQKFARVWNADSGEWEHWLGMLSNQAIADAQRDSMKRSAERFLSVYNTAREIGNRKYVQRSLSNLGTLKGMAGDLDSARFFLNAAALEARDQEDIFAVMPLLINLANIDMERGNYASAEQLLDSAYQIAERYKDSEMTNSVYNNMAYLREEQGRFDEAYEFLREYAERREELLDQERVRAVTEMAQKYQSERQRRLIQQLELDKLDSEMENVRIRSARNRTLFFGGFVLLIAIALWSRLRYVRKSRAAIQREKDISDGLLLNILPASVAEELKEKGKTEAKFYETATIMFSDFKDFTRTASQVTAKELVNGINTYFKAFDEIITKNGVEKIKTIGDSYMAAGGIDEEKPVKASDVVRVALDIRDFVNRERAKHHRESELNFEMRVGIHSGPVVAGIVGVKKFQYDLWGDTVNIASRMETNGVPGKVNISESTYELIKDDPSFVFESRGMLDVKGKGEMMMYFVEWAEN